jgi:hypothetical protein
MVRSFHCLEGHSVTTDGVWSRQAPTIQEVPADLILFSRPDKSDHRSSGHKQGIIRYVYAHDHLQGGVWSHQSHPVRGCPLKLVESASKVATLDLSKESPAPYYKS